MPTCPRCKRESIASGLTRHWRGAACDFCRAEDEARRLNRRRAGRKGALARKGITMMSGIGFLVALTFTVSVMPAAAGPSDRDLAAAAIGLLALDCAQTHAIQRDGRAEMNTLLGSHPSRREINGYFAGCALTVIGVSAVLQPHDRRAFLYGVILLEAAVVLRNTSLGVGIRF